MSDQPQPTNVAMSDTSASALVAPMPSTQQNPIAISDSVNPPAALQPSTTRLKKDMAMVNHMLSKRNAQTAWLGGMITMLKAESEHLNAAEALDTTTEAFRLRRLSEIHSQVAILEPQVLLSRELSKAISFAIGPLRICLQDRKIVEDVFARKGLNQAQTFLMLQRELDDA
ncbi:hypothetical protein LTR85_008019 [Meristemomyces frigidus]|nr:hypothetical protein LTR85_008019 [Meristemomyces frigidus]